MMELAKLRAQLRKSPRSLEYTRMFGWSGCSQLLRLVPQRSWWGDCLDRAEDVAAAVEVTLLLSEFES